VSTLQREMGVELIEREGRGIRLTLAGTELARYAGQILGLAEQAVRRVQEVAGRTGHLHLAAVTTAGEYVVPPVLKLFRERYPDVQFRVEVGNRTWVLERLLSRDADLAVGGRPPVERGILGEPFLDNELVVVGAPDSPLAAQGVVEPLVLARETWLLREPGSGTRQTTEEFFADVGIEPRSIMTLGRNGAVKQAAAAGLGVTLLSHHAATAELAAGALIQIPVRGTPLRRSWYVLYLERDRLAGTTLAFLDLLRSGEASRAVRDWLRTAS
jgi:DNA-binding transcriptional LysR family regulator